jgi:hypothetical protein
LSFIVIFSMVLYKLKARFVKAPFLGETFEVGPIKGGLVDRQRGLLEGTARNVEFRETTIRSTGKHFWQAENARVIRFRAELTDSQGNITQYVAVEIACRADKWAGEISEGDKFRGKGEFKSDGVFHVRSLYNQTTNSMVGERE